MQVVAVISGAAWVWSWYIMYLEIHRWKHVTCSFRFNPPPPIPGTSIRPRPGLPLRALFVCAAGAPVVFASASGRGNGLHARTSARRIEGKLWGGLSVSSTSLLCVKRLVVEAFSGSVSQSR